MNHLKILKGIKNIDIVTATIVSLYGLIDMRLTSHIKTNSNIFELRGTKQRDFT
jgi:hypothetical protein